MALFAHPASRVLRALLLAGTTAGAAVTLAACDRSALVWVDDAPVRSTMPSPLAHPPFVAIDSTLVDSTALAAFLLTQDRLREAGAQSLLTDLLMAIPESADTVSSTAPVARAAMTHSSHGMNRMDTAASGPLGDGVVPRDDARCARTLRTVFAPGFGTVALWWTRVAKGRVHLVAAWRDGSDTSTTGAWRGPMPVDTLDQGPGDAQAAERGAHGCIRPAPSVAWDSRTNFLHVAYTVRGPEGPGVFYAHQMDPRASFEVPIAVLYGEQLGIARVASAGDVVAVTYEDPNTRGRSRVGVAISRTAGHTFEEQRLIASGDVGEARDPHVAVFGRAVVLGWSDVATVPNAEPVFVTRRLRVQR